jgi:hypothetical protein
MNVGSLRQLLRASANHQLFTESANHQLFTESAHESCLWERQCKLGRGNDCDTHVYKWIIHLLVRLLQHYNRIVIVIRNWLKYYYNSLACACYSPSRASSGRSLLYAASSECRPDSSHSPPLAGSIRYLTASLAGKMK